MNDIVIGGGCKNAVHSPERILQNGGEIRVLLVRGTGITGTMMFWYDPGFEGESRCERRERNKTFILGDHAGTPACFLPDDVAEYTPFLEFVVSPGPVQFFLHLDRHDRQRDELGMRVLERCAGRQTLIFEDERILEAGITLQIFHAVTIRPQHFYHGSRGKRGKGGIVIRALDDHLVSADPVHSIEDALTLFVQFSFYLESREFIRHHPESPARAVRGAIITIGERFVRRGTLIPLAKGAETGPLPAGMILKVRWPLAPF